MSKLFHCKTHPSFQFSSAEPSCLPCLILAASPTADSLVTPHPRSVPGSCNPFLPGIYSTILPFYPSLLTHLDFVFWPFSIRSPDSLYFRPAISANTRENGKIPLCCFVEIIWEKSFLVSLDLLLSLFKAFPHPFLKKMFQLHGNIKTCFRTFKFTSVCVVGDEASNYDFFFKYMYLVRILYLKNRWGDFNQRFWDNNLYWN